MDETGAYYTEWNKPERKTPIQYVNAYIWNLERSERWPYISQFSYSVVSDSLWPHELQHARPPCPSPTPWVQPNPCPLCRWCHSIISSSVVPFSSCPQSFPTSGSFQMSQLFISRCQGIEVSASTSVLWTPRTDFLKDGLVGYPCSQRDSQESSSTTQLKSINSSALSFLYTPTLTSIHDHWKKQSLD